MKRKDFIKNSLLTAAVGVLSPQMFRAANVKLKESNYDTYIKNTIFNNTKNKTMNKIVHKAGSRGHANLGWLNSHHTFSFARYHNPERMNFGVLRVLNDDQVNAGQGFGTHPHDNMEIISIPLKGDLEHKDSMGNVAVIKEGDIQVLSAGTGIYHSEYNKNTDKDVEFLQIWVFPNKKNTTPRYDQISINELEKENKFYQVLSPNKEDQGVWIHQDAWFSIGKFAKGNSDEYKINKEGNGVYMFVLEGEVEIDNTILSKRDGMGIANTNAFTVNATENARVLLMEVPMEL